MKSNEKSVKNFMDKLKNGELKKETITNPPPYFNGTKEEVTNRLESYKSSLNSDIFKKIMKIK